MSMNQRRARRRHQLASRESFANPVYDATAYDRKNPVVGTMLGVGVVAALGIGLFLYWRSKKSGNQAVTIQPGAMAIHGQFVGANIALGLPEGNWNWTSISVDGVPLGVVGAAPATVPLNKPSGVITATWGGWPKHAPTPPGVTDVTAPIMNTTTLSYGP